MQLNHINLTVTDVTGAAAFLQTYFGLKSMGGNKGMAFLQDDRGMVIALMKAKRADYPETFHIGFIQPSDAEVDAINERMKADGFEVAAPQRLHAWTFYVQSPGGLTVEVLSLEEQG
jgi:lactoylglutathione lyase